MKYPTVDRVMASAFPGESEAQAFLEELKKLLPSEEQAKAVMDLLDSKYAVVYVGECECPE
jgi:hypothetical protein